MHALRLGLQGIELLTTGRITLPVPEPDRAYLRSIRRGERPLTEVAGVQLWGELPDPLALIRAIAYEGSDAAEPAAAARVLQAATRRLLDHMSEGGD
jgi:hypothetical protein